MSVHDMKKAVDAKAKKDQVTLQIQKKMEKLKGKIDPNLDVLEAVIELASLVTSAEHLPSPLNLTNPNEVAWFFNGQRNVILALERVLEESKQKRKGG